MAEVRNDRQRVFFPVPMPERRRSPAVLVMLLLAVLAAIALIWNASRRSAARVAAPAASPGSVETLENSAGAAEPAAAPSAAAAAAAASEPAASAVAPAPAVDESGAGPDQAEISRVIADGRAGLTSCYQRALVHDETLLRGQMNVRISVAPSGRVGAVNISGPAAFRPVQPCVKDAIANWKFPTADEAYTTAFSLGFRGKE